MRRRLICLGIVLPLLYLGDFLSLRLQVPHREQFGSVTVHTFYVVKLKSGRSEYDFAGDRTVSCVNSLFPQIGNPPCWYARRRTEEQISIDSGNPNNPHIF